VVVSAVPAVHDAAERYEPVTPIGKDVRDAAAATAELCGDPGGRERGAGKSGIGNGTITLKEGHWPKEVVLRFQHGKGQPFKGLEDFHLTTARFKVDGSQKKSKAMPFSLAGDDGKFADGPAGTLNVVVEETKDGMEVRLPANLLAGASNVKVEWVDFYRN